MKCFNIGCPYCNECDGNDPDCRIAIRKEPYEDDKDVIFTTEGYKIHPVL